MKVIELNDTKSIAAGWLNDEEEARFTLEILNMWFEHRPISATFEPFTLNDLVDAYLLVRDRIAR